MRHLERTREQRRLVCVLAVFASTIIDWLNCPLARRFGATQLGAFMDIVADSLLPLALAVAAVR